MSKADDEQQARVERAREIGLFRYMLIREAADPTLTRRQRGAMVRAIAARSHTDPFGRVVTLSRWTLDRWIQDWRRGGFDALVPSPRQSQPRTPAEVLDLAAALKKENPQRTAAQIRRILAAQHGWAPDERTLQRMFVRTGLSALSSGGPVAPAVFGRFEADRPNQIWTGDALHGNRVDGRKTFLFAFLDDNSRAVVGHRWGFAEDTIRLAAALRPALAARGVPEYVYVDNGSAFVDSWLLRACAKLGIKLVHSTPGRPQGRGKIERFFRDVNSEFLVEIAAADGAPGRTVRDLAELNRLFTAWVETVYHRRVHSETGQAPLARWLAGGPFPVPAPADLTEAFRWSEHRTVSKTAVVSLHGNRYQVDPLLVGRRVELVFDPFDLTNIRVRVDGADHGRALPHQISRHAHPKARPETPGRTTQADHRHRLPGPARRAAHRHPRPESQLHRPRRRAAEPAARSGAPVVILRLDGHLLVFPEHATDLLELLDLLSEVLRYGGDDLVADITDRFGPRIHAHLIEALDTHIGQLRRVTTSIHKGPTLR